MTDDNTSQFEPEHLRRWWETTHRYLFADMESLPGAAAGTQMRRPPPQANSCSGRKRFMARVRDQILRSVMSEEKDDPLRALENAFQNQVTFIVNHPDVPRRLLSWLAREDDSDLPRQVRMLIAYYASRLAQIITRAKRQGLVETRIKPDAAAIALISVIRGLVLRMQSAPPQRESFLREAAEAWTLYRAALAGSFVLARTF